MMRVCDANDANDAMMMSRKAKINRRSVRFVFTFINGIFCFCFFFCLIPYILQLSFILRFAQLLLCVCVVFYDFNVNNFAFFPLPSHITSVFFCFLFPFAFVLFVARLTKLSYYNLLMVIGYK